jgi:hypothetical protein
VHEFKLTRFRQIANYQEYPPTIIAAFPGLALSLPFILPEIVRLCDLTLISRQGFFSGPFSGFPETGGLRL